MIISVFIYDSLLVSSGFEQDEQQGQPGTDASEKVQVQEGRHTLRDDQLALLGREEPSVLHRVHTLLAVERERSEHLGHLLVQETPLLDVGRETQVVAEQVLDLLGQVVSLGLLESLALA